MKKHKIWSKKQGLIKRMLRLHTEKNSYDLLLQAEKIDHLIKGVRTGNVWNEIECLAVGLGTCLFMPIGTCTK
jgi:hypothetical protein